MVFKNSHFLTNEIFNVELQITVMFITALLFPFFRGQD